MTDLQVFVRHGVFFVRFVVVGFNKRQQVQRSGEKIVAHLMLAQEPLFFIVEQTAVVTHDAVFRVTVVYGVYQAFQVFPKIVLVRVAAFTPAELAGLLAKRLDGMPPVEIGFVRV